jgi:hypothetical protein
MSIIENFERKVLFSLTRFLAMLIVFSLIAAIVVGAVVASGTLGKKVSTKVSANEVLEVIKPPVADDASNTPQGSPPQSGQPDTNLPSGEKLPFALQKHFNTPDNIKVLRGWLNAVRDEYHQEFIDEMAAVVVEAEKQNLSAPDAINAYKELKLKKLEAIKMAKAELEQTRLYYAAAAVSCTTLVALFSLILVLLAIERNTRRAPL